MKKPINQKHIKIGNEKTKFILDFQIRSFETWEVLAERTMILNEKVINAMLDYVEIKKRQTKGEIQHIHHLLRQGHTQPEKCEDCLRSGQRLELAFKLHNVSKYTKNIEDYEWLCASCHRKKDAYNRKVRKNGIKVCPKWKK